MKTNRYRADYYLFRHFLMGMGSFQDSKVSSPEAMKLLFGVNRPFRIRLEDAWFEARAALLDGGVPHYVNGEGDWQIFLWIDPDTSLAGLLNRRALKGRPWAIHNAAPSPSMTEIIQTVGDLSDPAGALEIAESLIYSYGGAKAVPATWDRLVKKAVTLLDQDIGAYSVRSLAERVGRDPVQLDADFRLVLGTPLHSYIHRLKWQAYIKFRRDGQEMTQSLRSSGLIGWEGLRDDFENRYGLELDVLENSLPFVRVYEGYGDRPVLYL